MTYRPIVLGCFAAVVICACTNGESNNQTKDDYEQNYSTAKNGVADLATFAGRLQEFSGQFITVRGYLKNFAPALILVENEDSNVFEEPAIIVADLQLRSLVANQEENFDESQHLAALGCRDRHVEIVGEVGFLPQYDNHGIIRIKSISTFSDVNFTGDSEICYSASS